MLRSSHGGDFQHTHPGIVILLRRLGVAACFSLILALAVSASLSVSAGADWPKFHNDLGNTGFNPAETAISPGNVGNLRLAWSAPNFGMGSAPVVVGGEVIAPCWPNAVCAVDAATGQARWTHAVGHVYLPSNVAVSAGIVYAGGTDPAVMYALNAQTGAVIWTWPSPAPAYDAKTAPHLFAAPTVFNGTVFAEADDWKLYAFDASTGVVRWTQAVYGLSTPAISDGVLFVEGDPNLQTPDQGALLAINAQTGQILWRTVTQWGAGDDSPSVAAGLVYTGSRNTPSSGHPNFWAYRASGCGLPLCPPVWTSSGGSYARSSPAVANGVVYEGFGDGRLYAFDAATGQRRWSGITQDSQSANPIGMWSSPAVANGVVLVASGDGSFYAFNAAGCGQASCSPLWRSTTAHSYQFGSSPAIANGMVYVTGFGSCSAAYCGHLDAFRVIPGRPDRATPPQVPQSGSGNPNVNTVNRLPSVVTDDRPQATYRAASRTRASSGFTPAPASMAGSSVWISAVSAATGDLLRRIIAILLYR